MEMDINKWVFIKKQKKEDILYIDSVEILRWLEIDYHFDKNLITYYNTKENRYEFLDDNFELLLESTEPIQYFWKWRFSVVKSNWIKYAWTI